MPLDPNTFPLPYIAEYLMIFVDEVPDHYEVTVYDKIDPNLRASGATLHVDVDELNIKIKELADQIYP